MGSPYARRPEVLVVNGVVVPQGYLSYRASCISVYDGPWGYFITKAPTSAQRDRKEATVLRRYGIKPLYRINLKRKGTGNT